MLRSPFILDWHSLFESQRSLIPYASSIPPCTYEESPHSLFKTLFFHGTRLFTLMTLLIHLPIFLPKWFVSLALSHKMNTQKFSFCARMGLCWQKGTWLEVAYNVWQKRYWMTTRKKSGRGFLVSFRLLKPNFLSDISVRVLHCQQDHTEVRPSRWQLNQWGIVCKLK